MSRLSRALERLSQAWDPPPQVVGIDPAEIASWYAGKTLSVDWTSGNFPIWTSTLHLRRYKVRDVLEVGSLEGRSALFWLNYFANCRLTCIDTFAGHQEARNAAWPSALASAEDRFDANVASFGSRVEKMKSLSHDALAQLGIGGRTFDFVYLDGSHRAADVYSDATLAWPMLRAGGIMLFDDYEWSRMPDEKDRPKLGIEAFLRVARGTYRELHGGWQILIEKR